MNLTLSEIVTATGGKLENPPSSEENFQRLSTDTRTLQKGDLFLALRGDKFDGNRFAMDSQKNGAAGLILENSYRSKISKKDLRLPTIWVNEGLKALGEIAHTWRKKFEIPVLAITGSNGKTTTRAMTGALLKQKFQIHEPFGNYNNRVGLPLTLLELEKNHQVAILEMGMNHLGEIAQMTEIAQPTHALITNIGPVHLAGLGNIETVAKAKGELFQGLESNATVFVNVDDPFCVLLAEKAGITKEQQITFGWKNPAQIQVQNVLWQGPGGGKVFIQDHYRSKGDILELKLPLPGEHNVYNLVAAVSFALAFRLTPEEMIRGAQTIVSVGARSRIASLAQNRFLIDDCYNANPVSMRAALQMLKTLRGSGQGIAILGEMLELGDSAEIQHYELGRIAADLGVHHLFIIGQHAADGVKGALKAGMRKDQIHEFFSGEQGMPPESEIEKISEAVWQMTKPGDWILVKGSRGMALERVVQWLQSQGQKGNRNL